MNVLKVLSLFLVINSICFRTALSKEEQGSSFSTHLSETKLGRQRRAASLKPGGKNVCQFKGTKTVYSQESRTVSTIISKTVCCSDWIRCWKYCERPQVLEKKITVTVSKLVPVDIYHCCTGFSVDSSGVECSKPICNPYCRNLGSCIGPNQCKCIEGFDGRFCQIDVNECLDTSKSGCSQQCINLPGTFSCACQRGYVPKDPESKQCEDIDECRHNPCKCTGTNCNNLCVNTPGSYKCQCGSGYRLSRWNLCTDLNECVEQPDICPQRCINLPGSYQCHCWPGFQWNSDKRRCDEVNECSIGNGGCEHNCHNIFGGHVCSCKSGFYLASDRYGCIDFNECNGLTECDAETSRCVNTDGDYYCQCKNGFRYSSNNRTCEDRNECAERTDLCDQQCINNFGSYSCRCSPGFQLTSDGKTCEDIDECKQNVCAQRCVNTVGSFYCACNPGYLLDADGKNCRPQVCEKIFPPFYGDMNCNGESLGKACNASCQGGFRLAGEKSRVCLPTGKWSGHPASCLPNNCPQPIPPENAKVTLPCEVTFGSTCPVTCSWGYVRRGSPIIQCVLVNGKVQWNADKVRCEEILVCKPNPCQNGGKCSIVTPTEYYCNCSGTGFDGVNCEYGVVSLPRFPKMKVNVRSDALAIHARPATSLKITIFANDPAITVSPNDQLTITAPQSKATFSILSSTSGLRSLAFYPSSTENFRRPNDALVLFYHPKLLPPSMSSDLTTYAKDCHELDIYAHSYGCASSTLLSSAAWQSRGNGLPTSFGVVVIKVGVSKLPLVVTGADPVPVFFSLTNLQYSFNQQSSNTQCSSKLLSEDEQQYISKNDIFAKTFIKEFSKLTPTWFQLSLGGELTYFGHNSIRAFLWPGSKVKAFKHCSNLAIEPNSLFVVYLHKEHLSMQVQSKSVFMKTNGVFCFAVDVCSYEAHLAIPDDNVQHLENLLSFDELQSLGWTVNAKAIGFSKGRRSDLSTDCLDTTSAAPSSQKVLLGGTNVNFESEKGLVRANIKGDLFMGTTRSGDKETLVSVPTCIEGSSKVETSLWVASDRATNQYAKVTYDRKLTLASAHKTDKAETLVVSQKEHGYFSIKSGIPPALVKNQDPIDIGFMYKESESSSTGAGDDIFEKITSLQTLSFVLDDLNLEMALLSQVPSSSLALFEDIKARITSFSTDLTNNLNEFILDFSNTKLINERFKVYFYKLTSLLPDLKKLRDGLKTASGLSAFVSKLEKSMTDLNVIHVDMAKRVAVKSGPKKFSNLYVAFTGKLCVLKSCLDNAEAKLVPLYNAPGSTEFCYNPRKGPFQTLEANVAIQRNQQGGLFFSFDKGAKFVMCLEKEGARKITFKPNIVLFDHQFTENLAIDGTVIKPQERSIPVIGKYQFKVKYNISVAHKRWNMITVPMNGKATVGSQFINEIQLNIHVFVATQYQKLQNKIVAARNAITKYQNDENYLRGRVQSDQNALDRAKRRLVSAKATYDKNKLDHAENQKIFVKNRQALLDIEAVLNKECLQASCPITCVKIDKCDVCQKPVFLNKTVPKCSVKQEDRSYNYTSTYLSRCSHMVQDRTLKYTGNCPKPKVEQSVAEAIIKGINDKIKANKSLTIEDALNLQLVNETAGRNIQKAIEKANFFKTLPDLLQQGLLIDSDFVQLAGYTNQSFAEKIREQQKNIIRAKVLTEIFEKINNSQKLGEEDFLRVERVDPEMAEKLRKNQVLGDLQKKLERGENLTEADLQPLRAIDPKLAENVTSDIIKQLRDRQLMVEIQKKLEQGDLKASDLKRLELANPEMANKLKEALKEQLKKKVEEMEKKLKNVKNSIKLGTNNTEFASLEDQLQKLTQNTKPIDKDTLEKLQKKLNQINVGSPFQNVHRRLDLNLDVMNITGKSKDLENIVEIFSSTLSKFDLPKILQGSEVWILSRLEDIQEWFKTAVNIVQRVCTNCEGSCSTNDAVHRVLSPIKRALGKYQVDVCQRTWKVGFKFSKILETCRLISVVKSFLDLKIYKPSDCLILKEKVIAPLTTVAQIWKDTRALVPQTFKEQWQNAEQTVRSLDDYLSFASELSAVLRTVSTTAKLSVKPKAEILLSIEQTVRNGKYTVGLVEIELVMAVLLETQAVLDTVPKELKRLSGSNIILKIGDSAKQKLRLKLSSLISDLSTKVSSLCKGSGGLSNQAVIDLETAKRSVKKIFDEFLMGGSVPKVYEKAEHVSSLLKQYQEIALKEYLKLRTCVSKEYKSPVEELKKILSEVKPFVTKSYKDLLNDVKKNLQEVGNNIALPLGKIIDSVKELSSGIPNFNLPLFLFINPKDSQLALNALHEFLQMSAKSINGIVEIIKKCPSCLPSEVFGSKGLKGVVESLDRAIKPIVGVLKKFISKSSFSPQGAAVLITSLERTRASLQRIYRSETLNDIELWVETVNALEKAADAVKDTIKGYVATYKAFATSQSKDLKEFVKTLGQLTILVRQTYEKLQSSGKGLKEVYSKALDLYSSLRELPSKLEDVKNGPVERRLEVIQNTADILKDIPTAYEDALGDSKNVLGSSELDDMGQKLDSLGSQLDVMTSNTMTLLQDLNVGSLGYDQKRGFSYVQFRKSLIDAGAAKPADKKKILNGLQSKVTSGVNYVQLIRGKAKSLFSSISGTVDEIKEKVHNIRRRVDKYKVVYQDVMKTVEDLKKGPLSEIGRIKDGVESLVDSMKEYDFRKMLSSDPDVLKRKLQEFRQLVTLTGSSIQDMDKLLRQCKTCKVQDVYGYKFVRDLIVKVNDAFSGIFEHMEGFADKVGDVAGEFAGISKTLKVMNNRFSSILKEGKVDADTLKRLSEGLIQSYNEIDMFQQGTNRLAKLILGEDVDLSVIWSTTDSLIKQFEIALNKSVKVAGAVQETSKKVSALKSSYLALRSKVTSLKGGPTKVRIEIAKDISRDVKGLINSLPDLLASSQQVLSSLGIDEKWLDSAGEKVELLISSLGKVMQRTDRVMAASEIAVEGHDDIRKDVDEVGEAFKAIGKAPLKDRITAIRNAASKVDTTVDKVVDTTLKTAKALDLSLTKEDLVQAADSAIGRERIKKFLGLYSDISRVLIALENGPIDSIGKLTDSVDDFVAGLKDYDLGKALLTDPASLKEKVAQFQQMASATADIFTNISQITGTCVKCSLEGILGKKFINKMSKTIGSKFSEIYENMTRIGKRVQIGYQGWQGFVGTAKKISDSFKDIEAGKSPISVETFKRTSDALRKSAVNLQSLKQASSSIFQALFDDQKDLKNLQLQFDGLIDQVSLFMNKSAVVSDKVEEAFKVGKELHDMYKGITENIDAVKEGPVEARVKVIRNIIKGVNGMITGLPELLNKTGDVQSALGVDGAWLRRFGYSLSQLSQRVSGVLNTTDTILESVNVALPSISNISRLSKGLQSDFDKLLSAPWKQKFDIFNDSLKKMGSILDNVNGVTSVADDLLKKLTNEDYNISSSVLNMTSGISGLLNNVSSAISHVQGIFNDVTGIIDAVKAGPVAKVGKLTDSIQEFTDKIKDYDLKEILLLSPKFAKEKLGEIKDIIRESGAIMGNVSDVVAKVCPSCNFDALFGTDFVNATTLGLEKAMDKVFANATSFLDKLSDRAEDVSDIIGSVNGIKNGIQELKLVSFSSKGFKKLSNILSSSSGYLEVIKNSSGNVFDALFGKDQELLVLKGKFEGFVTNIASFLDKASNLSGKATDAMEKVEAVQKTFREIKGNLDSVTSGPLENRVQAVQNIVQGVSSIMSGLPDLLKSASLGLDSTGFLRRMGVQLEGVTGGIQRVLNKTNLVLDDVGSVISGVSDITRTSKAIGADFQRILSAPWSKKFDIALEAVNKVKTLTQQINGVAADANNIFSNLTGTTLIKTSIFGNGTAAMLDKFSNGITLLADRYEKFRELTKTIGEAFNNISNDPIQFALEGLPKLFRESEQLINTLINDSKGIMSQLGIQIDGLNLSPELVAAAKNFYGFAQATLGTIQSGKQLIGDFKDLFESKNFKEAMENLQKVTETGTKFIDNLDNVGKFLFKEDWKDIKGNFKETLNEVGESLGIDMEKVGDWFNNGLEVATGALSIVTNIKDLFKMKEFDARTVAEAAQKVINIAQQSVKLMQKFGVNINSAALSKLANGVTVVAAVVQIVVGIKDFIKWMNDVCDITYKTEIINKNISYVCVKNKIMTEIVQVPVSECTYVSTQVRSGFTDGEVCCTGKECVYMQETKCLERNQVCFDLRNRKLKDIANMQKDIIIAYEALERSRLSIETALIDMKSADYLIRKAELSLNVTNANINRVRIQKARSKKIYDESNQALTQLSPIVDRINNRSLITIKEASFDMVLYDPSVKAIPIQISCLDQTRKSVYVSVVANRTREKESISLITRKIFTSLTDFIPRRKRRSADEGKISGDVQKWALKCAELQDDTSTLLHLFTRLQQKVEQAYETPVSNVKDAVVPSSNPKEATETLGKVLNALEGAIKSSVGQVLYDWKKYAERVFMDHDGASCTSYEECVPSFLDEMLALFEPAMGSFMDVKTILGNIEHSLLKIGTSPQQKNTLLQLTRTLIESCKKVVITAEFCYKKPKIDTPCTTVRVAYLGEEFTMDCPVTSGSKVSYLWKFNGTLLSDQTTKTLVLRNVDKDDQGSYVCLVSNFVGTSYSKAVLVLVNKRPVIVNQPEDILVYSQDKKVALFYCNVTGDGDLQFDWKYISFSGQGRVLANNGLPQLEVTGISKQHIGYYWCEVTDGESTIVSNRAKLTFLERQPIKEVARFYLDISTDKLSHCLSILFDSVHNTELVGLLSPLLKKELRLLQDKNVLKVSVIENIVKNNTAKVEVLLAFGEKAESGSDASLTIAASRRREGLEIRIKNFFVKVEKGSEVLLLKGCPLTISKPVDDGIDFTKEELSCPLGMEPDSRRTRCVQCAEGTYDAGLGKCAPCWPGTFQNLPGREYCDTCNGNLNTLIYGAASSALCTPIEYKCNARVRVLLTLDAGTGVSSSDWQEMSQFTHMLISSFDPAVQTSSFSIASFGAEVVVHSVFGDKVNSKQLIQRPNTQGNSRLDLALRLANDIYQLSPRGEDERRVVLIVGRSVQVQSEEARLKITKLARALRQKGIDIFYVSVGSTTYLEGSLVSKPDEKFLLRVPDFQKVTNYAWPVSHRVCRSLY